MIVQSSPVPAARPLKVLHVISGDLWAGAEVQAYTLITNLQKQPGIEIAAALLNEGELTQRLRATGASVTVFDERRLGWLQITAGLRALMDGWQPDIVHTHRSKENVLGALANRFGRNVPSIRTAHGASERAPRGLKARGRHALIGSLDLWCARYAQQKVIAVSGQLGVKLAEALPPGKIVVIENGVDPDAVLSQRHPVEFRVREPDATHIGIVGRLVPVKRVDLFLAMAASLCRDAPQQRWRFHVFGDGPLRDSLRALANELGLASVLTFHGHRTDSIACMAALDAVVMCSDHEGLPMTALEAIVVGTPMVAHAVGGLTEVLSPANLVHEHDAGGYAAAVMRIIVAGGAPAEARAQVLAAYSAARNAARVRSLYEQLCGLDVGSQDRGDAPRSNTVS
jgi:glycosyltransferase involved in cell wall biosynthesis